MTKARLVQAAILLLIVAAGLFAAEPVQREFTAEENELVRICDDWTNTLGQWHQEAQEINDEEQRQLFLLKKTDSAPFVSKVIAFERSHRGTHVGLMAVRQLTRAAMGAYRRGSPEYQAASHVLECLRDYGEHSDLTEVLRYLEFFPLYGVESSLRLLIAEDSGLTEPNRDFAKFILASWILEQRDNRGELQRWVADVDAKKVEAPKWLRDSNAAILEGMVPAEKLPSLVAEAVDVLENLADSNARRIAVRAVNDNRYIVEADLDATERMPCVKDMAVGLLFKERHLQVGRPAPDLKVKLISGEEFAFSQQRGKVLVVQFSFTGCGPCEATYPALKDLAAKYPDRLAIITFMRDSEPGDAREAVRSGKMTWNVSWDGVPAVNATSWGVVGYPTIYVFGSDGLLVERQLSWDKLQEKVEVLLK